MKYFKNIEGDYITAICTGSGDVEISKEEYETIMSLVHNRLQPEPGYDYKLRTDCTFELVEAPIVSDEE